MRVVVAFQWHAPDGAGVNSHGKSYAGPKVRGFAQPSLQGWGRCQDYRRAEGLAICIGLGFAC